MGAEGLGFIPLPVGALGRFSQQRYIVIFGKIFMVA